MHTPPNLWRLQQNNKNLLGQTAKILTYTTVYTAPSGFENQTPYTIAIAKLENGQTITTQVVNPKNIKINAKAKIVIRRLKTPTQDEIIDYGPKLELI